MAGNVPFKKLIREYMNINPRLGEVRVRTEPCTVISEKEISVPTAPEVRVDNAGMAELKTSQHLKNTAQFTIVEGFCKDLQDKNVTFDLPGGYGRIQAHLGEEEQKVASNQVQVELISSCGNGRKAKALTEKKDVLISFTSKAYPEGKILSTDGLGSIGVQSLIAQLKDTNPGSVDQFQWDEDKSKFYWIIEGIYKVRKDTMHAHNWVS